MQDNVKVPSGREFEILQLLINGSKYGLQILDEYTKRTGRKLPLGSLYVTMDRMVAAGFVKPEYRESTEERGGNRRKYFQLTATGHAALDGMIAYRSAFEGRLKGI